MELDDPAPLQFGVLSISGLDLTPHAARIDLVGDDLVGSSMQDAEFSIYDIARAASRILDGDWKATRRCVAVSADLTSATARARYTNPRSRVQRTLRLTNLAYGDLAATFEPTDYLNEIAVKVAAAVACDIDRIVQASKQAAPNEGTARMSTTTLTPVDASARNLAATLSRSGDRLAAALTCFEVNGIIDLFVAVGDKGAAIAWIEHHERAPACEGHTIPDAPAPAPLPETEHSYALSKYAYAAARALGPGWGASSGFLGAWGLIYRRGTTVALRLYVDNDDDLLGLDGSMEQYIDTSDLRDSPPHSPAELAVWGQAIAAEIRAAFPDA
ncbi:hypothetical protein PUR49_32660 [Streptomyces sp. BE147]|uniref:hypothetical protein n=1 Tax=Streptomyces sp. BE147 TaxID=3002524 RepID=UPI002E75ECAA|nr:hypothetical protein [Streptomyces sp. BE147]MEE1741224.1 hypothetical protein [Streptomyces sp. BE147]